MPLIKDVARRAGVSIATVSRVINNNDSVKPKNRERVILAIKELNYQPSGIARSMRSQNTRVLGVVIPDIQNPFFTSLIRAIQDVADENQYNVILCNSDDDSNRQKNILSLLMRERVRGIIIAPADETFDMMFLKTDCPIVIIDREIPTLTIDTVTLNNYSGAYNATDYLIKMGHRQIGLINVQTNISAGRDRQKGYVAALVANGLPVDISYIKIGNNKVEGGYISTVELLKSQLPTAILIANNLMTLGAIKAIGEFGLKIPDDISIIGYEAPWLDIIIPQISAVCHPVYQVGKEACKLLFERIRNKDNPYKNIILQPHLSIRQSVKQI